MVSTQSLFLTPAADITLERVQDLVDQTLPEGFTLEYKEAYTQRLVDSVAAMANTYGGLILVGVKDSGSERLVGVDADAVTTQIVSSCHDRIEPPWEPEVVSTSLPSGQSVLVVRVDPARAPRPLLIDGRAPIRLQGRNAWADRSRLAELFRTSTTSPSSGSWRSQQPQLPTDPEGNPLADFLLSSGLTIPLGDRAGYRPLSERSIDVVARALDGSALGSRLLQWSQWFGVSGTNPFRRHGFNRARRVTLRWEAVPRGGAPNPVESRVTLTVPDSPSPGGVLLLTVGLTIWAKPVMHEDAPTWKLGLADLYDTMDSMMATLVSDELIRPLAGIADVDPVVVSQPADLYFQTGPRVPDLLYLDGVKVVPDAGPSHGANLLADPSLDLRSISEREEQIETWLVQVGMDAGLAGMERLVARIHEARHPKAP